MSSPSSLSAPWSARNFPCLFFLFDRCVLNSGAFELSSKACWQKQGIPVGGMRMPLVLLAFERPCRRGMRLTLVLPRNPLIGCALVQCSLVNETGGPLHSDTNGWLLARERERCLMILVCACLRRWQIRSRKSNSWQPCPVSRRPPCAARRNCCDHQPAARSSLASLLAVRACGPRPKPSQQPARQ